MGLFKQKKPSELDQLKSAICQYLSDNVRPKYKVKDVVVFHVPSTQYFSEADGVGVITQVLPQRAYFTEHRYGIELRAPFFEYNVMTDCGSIGIKECHILRLSDKNICFPVRT